MTYIITEPCVDLKDAACVDVCPVDCIYTTEEDNMYFINPDECIDCAACEPVCPVTAIFSEDSVPEEWQSYIKLNYDYDYSELPKRVLKQFEFRGPTIGYQAEVRAAAVIRGYWTNEDAMTVADWVGKRFGKRPCGETVNNWNKQFRKVVRKNHKAIVSFLREEMLPKKKVSGL